YPYQVLNVNGGLQYGELGVVVQVCKRGLFQAFQVFPDLLLGYSARILGPKGIRDFLGGRLEVDVLESDGLNGSGMGLVKTLEIFGLHFQLSGSEMPVPDQFQETAGGGLHVRRGMVRLCKGTVEKVLVQFGQGGQLELAPPAPGKPTEFRGQFATGVEDPQTCQRGFHPGPVELTAHDVDVEVHI